MRGRGMSVLVALVVAGLFALGLGWRLAGYAVNWHVIGSGGGRATAGPHALDATLGQAVVGSSSSASAMLHAGFWPGAAAQPATATPSPTATPSSTTTPTSTATPTTTSTAEPATPTSTPTATSTVELPPPTPVVVGPWQSWTNGNFVNALAVDGDNVWAGSAGGVVRWDLTTDSYARYLAPHGLPDNHVSTVVVDGAGRLWFGLSTWNGGVTVYDAGAWTTFTQRDGLATGWVHAVTIDGAGRKWIGTQRGLSVLSDNGTPHDKADDTWTTFTVDDGLPHRVVLDVAVDGMNQKWVGTSSGLSALDDNGTPHDKSDDISTTFTSADGLASDNVQTIAVDEAGNKWVGTSGGVSVLDDGGTPHDKGDDTWTAFTTDDGLIGNRIYAIAVDGVDRKWFAAYGAVSVLSDAGTPHQKGDDIWTTFTTADGLTGTGVWAVVAGTADEMWFGTWRGGVSRLDHAGTPHDKADDVWTSYVTGDWLPHNDVEAVLTEGANLAWIGTQGGLVAFDGSHWTIFDTGNVMAIRKDGAGRKWIGTSGGVKVLSDGGTPHDESDDIWTSFTTADGLVSNWVKGIAGDGAGRKWFVTDGHGVSLLDDAGTLHDKSDDAWTSFTAADGLASDRVHVAAVDGPNLVWFAHESDGVSLLDHAGTPHNKSDDVWTRFTPADGLAGGSVYSIVVDGAGRKWFGACGGVSVLDDGGTPHEKADDTWTTFRVGDCNQGLAIDAAGRKWIATGWSGVMVLDDAGTPHEQGDDVWRTYTRAEGLVEDRAQCIAVSSGGIVWVGTDGGVSRMIGGAQYRLYLPLVLR